MQFTHKYFSREVDSSPVERYCLIQVKVDINLRRYIEDTSSERLVFHGIPKAPGAAEWHRT